MNENFLDKKKIVGINYKTFLERKCHIGLKKLFL
jgi:hypothetical protein